MRCFITRSRTQRSKPRRLAIVKTAAIRVCSILLSLQMRVRCLAESLQQIYYTMVRSWLQWKGEEDVDGLEFCVLLPIHIGKRHASNKWFSRSMRKFISLPTSIAILHKNRDFEYMLVTARQIINLPWATGKFTTKYLCHKILLASQKYFPRVRSTSLIDWNAEGEVLINHDMGNKLNWDKLLGTGAPMSLLQSRIYLQGECGDFTTIDLLNEP